MFKCGLMAGSFDIIHPGYIDAFKLLGQNCIETVIFLNEKPINKTCIFTVDERYQTLLTCKLISFIFIYNGEEDLLQLLKFYEHKQPCRLLGTEYKNKEYTGKDLSIPIIWHNEGKWTKTKVIQAILDFHNTKQ